ncbi:ADP-ribosylation [Myriangium duriaei CBS 260.36]|uniref:ADP-ribosylation n=1 Tax=Myriangium duriaei CBS 260.36 TaxID=1168546 RepID=A0A9P4IT90_9PEZI|nr:ADP-ribosylation [Myriangium duriaei CBS 260.36]
MLSIYLFVSLFALLASCTTPATLYRSDKRGPDIIKKAGGFITRAHQNGAKEVCSLADHQASPSDNDPFISTSSSAEAAKSFMKLTPGIGSGWLYEIDSAKAGIKFIDCAAAGGAHQGEKEYAAEGNIPVDAIIACTQYTRFKAGPRILGCNSLPPTTPEPVTTKGDGTISQPSSPKSNNSNPGSPKSNNSNPGTPKSNNSNPGTPKSNNSNPGSPKSNNSNPGTPKSNNSNPSSPKSNNSNPSSPKSNVSNPSSSKSSSSKSDSKSGSHKHARSFVA